MSNPILTQLSFGRQTPFEPERTLRESLLSEPPTIRLMHHGATALTTHDLVSLVLGTAREPTIAARLIGELKNLAQARALSVKELNGLVPGITVERACRLLAALELSERVQLPREIPAVVKAPADAAAMLRDMAWLEQEQMRVILLDTKNKVIHTTTVYQGSVHTTVIRVSELMKAAVRANATSMLIAHNHPSGDPTPSPEDVAVTTEIVKAAKLLDIDLLDHIVIGEAGKFVSLKERGLGFGT
jgi:DNA repair protein RadC